MLFNVHLKKIWNLGLNIKPLLVSIVIYFPPKHFTLIIYISWLWGLPWTSLCPQSSQVSELEEHITGYRESLAFISDFMLPEHRWKVWNVWGKENCIFFFLSKLWAYIDWYVYIFFKNCLLFSGKWKWDTDTEEITHKWNLRICIKDQNHWEV